MKLWDNMWLMIILKVSKNQGFTLSLKTNFGKTTGGGQIDPPSLSRIKQIWVILKILKKNCQRKVS